MLTSLLMSAMMVSVATNSEMMSLIWQGLVEKRRPGVFSVTMQLHILESTRVPQEEGNMQAHTREVLVYQHCNFPAVDNMFSYDEPHLARFGLVSFLSLYTYQRAQSSTYQIQRISNHTRCTIQRILRLQFSSCCDLCSYGHQQHLLTSYKKGI